MFNKYTTDTDIISPDILRENRIPPGQAESPDLPVLHYGNVPHIDTEKIKFFIKGLVNIEREFLFSEFKAMPSNTLKADIHCVTGWSVLETYWRGVTSQTLMEYTDLKPEAKFVIVYSADGYTTNLPIEEFFKEDVLFATHYNDEPLTPVHGAPVRLVIPRLYFWKSAKWVIGLEFTDKDKKGYWESRGYHNHGDPWTEERFGL